MRTDVKSATKNAVWAVCGHYLPENFRGWRPFEAYDDGDKVPSSILEAMRMSTSGAFLPAGRFPSDNYPMRKNHPPAHEERVPHLFSSGFTMLSAASVEILSQFVLGQCNFPPTNLWHPDRVQQLEGTFYYLNLGNIKESFLPDASSEAYEVKRFNKESLWQMPTSPRDDEISFSGAALDGPDIWYERKVTGSFFISDRVAKAILEAGIGNDWKLLRCQVVGKQ